MANEITSTTLTNQILTEAIEAEVGPAIREAATLLPLCKIYDLGDVSTLTASAQFHAAVTVSTITDGTGLSNAAYSQTNATIAVSHYGAKVVVTDLALSGTSADHLVDIPKSLALDVVDKMDSVVGALLGGFTGGSQQVGSTGVDITWANMIQAATNLRLNAKGLARDGVYVLYPQQVGDLQSSSVSHLATGLTTTQAVGQSPVLADPRFQSLFGGSAGALSNYIGDFMGLPVISSVNVSTANSGADSAGALFVRNAALGAAIKWMPRVELQRTVVDGIPGYAILAHVAFGAGELRDLLGCSIITDR